VGWAFIFIGAMIATAGFILERRYHEEANATSFGMPRITAGGILNFLGVVLMIFGICCVMVGMMVQFL
jgi:hypothetical protein